MTNRRHDYRHPFAPDDRLRVELSAPGKHPVVTGQMVNLSVGGLAYLGEPPAGPEHGRRVVAHFAIPHGLRRFAIPAEVVHGGEGDLLGLRFLPLDDSEAQDERDKALWVFLMDEQRRAIRQRRAASPT
ncbi:MAG TPA: PilZ domain-containing protein [Gemmataceae bacterium]|nr:PilZ domain-containing protein [Gemmataceae bacterium]